MPHLLRTRSPYFILINKQLPLNVFSVFWWLIYFECPLQSEYFTEKCVSASFLLRGPRSQKLSCHSTIIEAPLLNVPMPFCSVTLHITGLALTDNKHLEIIQIPTKHAVAKQSVPRPRQRQQAVGNWNYFPEMLTQSAAAPLLAGTPRFRSLSPSSKPMFHLMVTTSFRVLHSA